MLESLHIEGYAIIDQLDVTFSTGLTVLSGETGAGKSILIGALSLVFGGKGESSAIRSGHDETRVTAIVRVTDSADALSWLADRGFEPEDGTVIIRRTLKSSGRGSIFLQSTPVTKVDLREFTSLLFDIHGQHEHQSLLRIDSHRELIDRFGGTSAAVDEFRKVFSELSEKRRELQGLADDEQRMLRERDILSFAVGEIESAALTPGEEEQLRQDVRLLSQGEQLFTSITEFHDRMAESSGGALAGVRRGLQEMRKIGELVEEFRPQIDRLENAFYEIEDIASSVRQFQETVDFSPARLEESEQRLAEIRRLEKKYGNSIGQILDYAADAKEKLSRMESLEEARSALIADIERLEKRVWKEAAGISERRKTAAASLEKEIGERLQYLGMQKACFSIQVTRLEREDGTPLCTQYGIDRLEATFLSGDPPDNPAHVLIVSDTDVLHMITNTSNGLDIMAQTLKQAGGGGTLALNMRIIPPGYRQLADRLEAQGWNLQLVPDKPGLLTFARAFSQATYGEDPR